MKRNRKLGQNCHRLDFQKEANLQKESGAEGNRHGKFKSIPRTCSKSPCEWAYQKKAGYKCQFPFVERSLSATMGLPTEDP